GLWLRSRFPGAGLGFGGRLLVHDDLLGRAAVGRGSRLGLGAQLGLKAGDLGVFLRGNSLRRSAKARRRSSRRLTSCAKARYSSLLPKAPAASASDETTSWSAFRLRYMTKLVIRLCGVCRRFVTSVGSAWLRLRSTDCA